MGAAEAIRIGFKLARRSRSAVWILFLANLGLSALAGLPIYRGILRFTGHSLMSQTLSRSFSVDWLVDFSVNSVGSLERYAQVIGLLGLLAIPMNTILAGGVLGRLQRGFDQPYALGDFFRDVGRYSGRLLRLMIIALVGYWIVFRVCNQALGGLVNDWLRDSLDDRPVFWARLGVSALVILGLGLINLVTDFARVKLVLEGGTSAAVAFLGALGFSLGRLRRALLVYLVPSLCGIVLLLVYRAVLPWQLVNSPLAEAGKYREPLTLALLFFAQQLVILGRYWFRVSTWAGEWSLYSGNR